MDHNAVLKIDYRYDLHDLSQDKKANDKINGMEKINILIFEYITGGGFNKQELPESLAREGLLMLRALTGNLAEIATVDLTIMLDQRMSEAFAAPGSAAIQVISPELDCMTEFNRLLPHCDAVWPIAPESGGLLESLCAAVEKSGKILLNSASGVVAQTGDKWLSYQELNRYGMPVVPTYKLADFSFQEGDWIIKPVDGVGCSDSFIIKGQREFNDICLGLDKSRYIIQPHILGLKTSLSCLFKQGRGWLLSVNLQQFIIVESQYKLSGLIVNISVCEANYIALIADIAKAFPGLWGYVGIDLIETGDKRYVLEINPRLTSSFAGIYPATGVNPARAVLELLEGDPVLKPGCDHPVNLIIQE
jgi:predicted ATP-grasp superfamily ATP-dependent carboligase